MSGCLDRRFVTVMLTAGLLACDDGPTMPDAPAPAFSFFGRPGGACARYPSAVATDEPSLVAAVNAAVPGDVIALDGMIALATLNLSLETDGVTLTCARPGSGIEFRNGRRLETFANDIAVEHLHFDAEAGGPSPIILFGSDVLPCCHNVRFAHNDVRGFSLTGVFALRRITELSIVHNRFESLAGALGAIQVQGGPERAVISRNTVVMALGAFGGINVLGSERVAVLRNRVTGAPFIGLRMGSNHSVWKANRVDGATGFGMLFEVPDRRRNLILHNTITASGTAGILVRDACENLFLGNAVRDNADDRGLVFESTTGANLAVATRGGVFDDGTADCDEDGLSDPNVVVRPGSIRLALRLARHLRPRITQWLRGEEVEME